MNPDLLHLYAGPSFHMEGYIVGTESGLKKLRDAIDKALQEDQLQNASVTDTIYTKDGEGYNIFIIRQDTDWQQKPWDKIALPYTHEDGLLQNTKDSLEPYELLTKEQKRNLRIPTSYFVSE